MKYGLYFAWVLATLGTLGSLFFSEVLHLPPCHLCWFQRIALFPLVLLLGIATFTNDRGIIRYALPLALIGAGFALYQVAIQEIPGWEPIKMCGNGPSCSEKVNIGLSFITIPMLSAVAFLFISFLLIKTKKAH